MKKIWGKNRNSFLWAAGFMWMLSSSFCLAEDKPVALWRLDEGNGATVADVSGNTISGVLYNVKWDAAGLVGACLKFNGANSYVEFARSPKLDLGKEDFTIGVWAKIDPDLKCGVLIGNGGPWGAGKIMLRVQNEALRDGIIEKRLFFATGKWTPDLKDFTDLWVTFPAWCLGQWTQIAAVRKGGSLSLFINGFQAYPVTRYYPKPSVDVSGGVWILGSIDGGQKDFFKGELDEVSVFNRALDEQEIKAIIPEPVKCRMRAMNRVIADHKMNQNLVYNSSFEVGLHGWLPVYNWGVKVTPDEKEAYHGRQSVRLVPHQLIESRFIKIGTANEYTLSVFMKARQKDTRAYITFTDGRGTQSRRSEPWNIALDEKGLSGLVGMKQWVRVSDKWERYSVSKSPLLERVDGGFLTPYYIVEIGNLGPGEIWIDAVQVEQGSLSPYKMTRDAEVSAEVVGKPYNLLDLGATATIKSVVFAEQSLMGRRYNLVYDVYDYYGNKISSHTHRVELKDNRVDDQLMLKPTDYGMQRVEVKLEGKGAAISSIGETAYGVMVPVRDQDKFVEDSFFGMQGTDNVEVAELCRRMGVKWFRKMDFSRQPLFWSEIEKEKGKFNWEGVDASLNNILDRKILLMVPLLHTPAWARKNPDDPYNKLPRDPKDFGNFVRAVVSRYKDKVKCWEMWNEPDQCEGARWGDEAPAEYFQLLKEGYTAAKEADPSCTVLGGGGMGVASFDKPLKTILDLGGLNYMDVFSYHTYGGMYQDIEKVKELKHMVKEQYGRDLRVWMTEGGIVSWPFYKSIVGGDVKTSGQEYFDYKGSCEFLARVYLKALAYGTEKFFYYYLGYPGGMSSFRRIGQQYTIMMEYDDTVTPVVLTHAVLANFLQGAKFDKAMDKQNDLIKVFVYDRKSMPIAAVWIEKNGTAEMRLKRRDAKVLEIKNIMGNKLEGKGWWTKVYPLSSEPLFIEGHCDRDRLARILDEADIKMNAQ